MSIFLSILGFLKSIFVDLLLKTQDKPGKEVKVEVIEGNAKPLDPARYDGLYGLRRLHDRVAGENERGIREPGTDS